MLVANDKAHNGYILFITPPNDIKIPLQFIHNYIISMRYNRSDFSAKTISFIATTMLFF